MGGLVGSRQNDSAWCKRKERLVNTCAFREAVRRLVRAVIHKELRVFLGFLLGGNYLIVSGNLRLFVDVLKYM